MFIEIHKISYKYYCKDKELTISHNEYGCSYNNYGTNFSVYNKYKTYKINNKYHNELGPAVIWINGRKSYYLYGNLYSYDVWIEQIKKNNICT